MAVSEDYYSLLGVGRGATDDEIRKAYRALARELHPDLNPDPAAEERFKRVSVAYETLSDPDKRAHYDRFGSAGAGAGANPGGAGFGGLGDLFDAFFGAGFGGSAPRPSRTGPDAEALINLTLADVVFGVSKTISVRTALTCDTCSGVGTKSGTAPRACSACGGTGELRRARQTILGQMVTSSPCNVCRATGEIVNDPCPTCRGDGRVAGTTDISIDVPAGVDTGTTLRLTGRGGAGLRGASAGDLYVRVRVAENDRFQRDGRDLHTALSVAFTQAALGATLKLETLDGEREVSVAAGTQPGAVVRLRGLGVPGLDQRPRGDLHVHLTVEVPAKLSQAEEALLRSFADERGEAVAEPSSGLLGRFKRAFQG